MMMVVFDSLYSHALNWRFILCVVMRERGERSRRRAIDPRKLSKLVCNNGHSYCFAIKENTSGYLEAELSLQTTLCAHLSRITISLLRGAIVFWLLWTAARSPEEGSTRWLVRLVWWEPLRDCRGCTGKDLESQVLHWKYLRLQVKKKYFSSWKSCFGIIRVLIFVGYTYTERLGQELSKQVLR